MPHRNEPEDPEVIEVEVRTVELPSISTRQGWFEDWEEATAPAQREAMLDRDYYDGKQWSPEEIKALKKRRQPVVTKNRIAKKVNTVIGEEIRKRIDPQARARTDQHIDSARVATDALRYVEEQQRFDDARTSVFKNVLVEGYGGAFKNVEIDEEDESSDPVHTLDHVQWDRLFYDPKSRAANFSDAKYMGMVLWMDIDDAISEYPEMARELKENINSDRSSSTTRTTDDTPRNWSDHSERRSRVKIVEMYFKNGDDWYRSDFTDGTDLRDIERTYLLDEKGRNSVCPLVMASCYVDKEGFRYGVVRALRSPQDILNKSASKAMHLANVSRVIAERDAILDTNKFRTELARPDGVALVEKGRLVDGTIKVQDGAQLAPAHITMMQVAQQDIDGIGPSSSNIPGLPESASGRALIARQQAASLEMGPAFDELRKWTRRIFEIDWLCIRQFWTEEMWLRVTDDRNLDGYRFVGINQRMTRAQRLRELMEADPKPELNHALETAAGEFAPVVAAQAGQQAQIIQAQQQQQAQLMQAQGLQPPQFQPPEPLELLASQELMQDQVTVNQVDRMLVDIILDEGPETAVIEQEEFEKIAQIMPAILQVRPDMAPLITETLIRLSQVRDRQEILESMRKPPDEEAQQAQQQAQQQQQAQFQAQLAQMQAQVQALQSQAALNQAKAQQAQADAQATVAKTPSEIEENEASARKDAAAAGEKM